MDKSYVGMFNCFICNEPTGILLDRRLKPTLEHNVGCINQEPCPKCKDFMKQGVILISVDASKSDDRRNPYRTGGWVVVKDEFIERFIRNQGLKESILRRRAAFIPDGPWDALGLPRGDRSPEAEEPQEGAEQTE